MTAALKASTNGFQAGRNDSPFLTMKEPHVQLKFGKSVKAVIHVFIQGALQRGT